MLGVQFGLSLFQDETTDASIGHKGGQTIKSKGIKKFPSDRSINPLFIRAELFAKHNFERTADAVDSLDPFKETLQVFM